MFIIQVSTFDDKEIENIYQNIKSKLIATKILLPSELKGIIFEASKFNSLYLKSYLSIFQKVSTLYPKDQRCHDIPSLLLYDMFYSKDRQIVKDELEKPKYSLPLTENNAIYRSIINDDQYL